MPPYKRFRLLKSGFDFRLDKVKYKWFHNVYNVTVNVVTEFSSMTFYWTNAPTWSTWINKCLRACHIQTRCNHLQNSWIQNLLNLSTVSVHLIHKYNKTPLNGKKYINSCESRKIIGKLRWMHKTQTATKNARLINVSLIIPCSIRFNIVRSVLAVRMNPRINFFLVARFLASLMGQVNNKRKQSEGEGRSTASSLFFPFIRESLSQREQLAALEQRSTMSIAKPFANSQQLWQSILYLTLPRSSILFCSSAIFTGTPSSAIFAREVLFAGPGPSVIREYVSPPKQGAPCLTISIEMVFPHLVVMVTQKCINSFPGGFGLDL